MKTDLLRIIPPDPRIHHDELFRLVAQVFSHSGGFYDFLDYCHRGYIDHSNYDWSNSRIGILDGKIVAHYGVWDLHCHVGRSLVRVAGIGVVATHGDYRGRGLMHRIIPATHLACREAGYHFALLFGISDFYHQYGYVRAWADVAYLVSLEDLPAEVPRMSPRPFAGHHLPALARLHNRRSTNLTGYPVRPTYLRNRMPDTWKTFLWKDSRGKVAGYVLVKITSTQLECHDAIGESEQVLRVLGQLARRFVRSEVRFRGLHHDSDLARTLRAGNCRTETRYRRSGGPMIRTLNLSATLSAIVPELSRRLKSSPLSSFRGNLLVVDAREKVTLSIRNSRVSVLPQPVASIHSIRGGDEIASLLFGADDPAEIIRPAHTRLTGSAKLLLPILFPNQHPNLSPWDRF